MEYPPISIGSIRATPLGEVWAAVSEGGLVCVEYGVTRLQFESTVHRQIRGEIRHEAQRLDGILRQVGEYLKGKRRDFDLDIDWPVLASDFQRAALRVVFSIPYGQTRTYADVAAQIGHPLAYRAVGRANATNPMPLIIPCHRVVGTDGKLHGYGGKGGLKTKAWLLKMEGAG